MSAALGGDEEWTRKEWLDTIREEFGCRDWGRKAMVAALAEALRANPERYARMLIRGNGFDEGEITRQAFRRAAPWQAWVDEAMAAMD